MYEDRQGLIEKRNRILFCEITKDNHVASTKIGCQATPIKITLP